MFVTQRELLQLRGLCFLQLCDSENRTTARSLAAEPRPGFRAPSRDPGSADAQG